MSYVEEDEGKRPTYALDNMIFVQRLDSSNKGLSFEFEFRGAVENGDLAEFRKVISRYPGLIHAVWKTVAGPSYYNVERGRREYYYHPIAYWLIYKNKEHRYEIMQYIISNFPDFHITANIGNQLNILHCLPKNDYKLFSLVFNDPRVLKSRLINAHSPDGYTPLMSALEARETTEESMEVIKLMLAHPLLDINKLGTKIYNNKDVLDMKGAIHCISRNKPEYALILAHPNINLNLQTMGGNTLLHLRFDSTLLGDTRINPNLLNKEGYSPLHRHCKFITATTKFSAEDTTSYYRDMKAFLEHPNVDVNLLTGDTEGLAAIHLAMDSRNYELIKLFLECDRVDVNIKSKRYGYNIIRRVFSQNPDFSLEYVKLLLTTSSSASSRRILWTIEDIYVVVTAFQSIYSCLHRGIVQEKIDSHVWTSIFEQWFHRMVETYYQPVEKAVKGGGGGEGGENSAGESGFDFRWSGNVGYGLYTLAVGSPMMPLLEYLFAQRIFDINDRCDTQENTALHIACEHEDVALVKYFLAFPTINLILKNKSDKTAYDVIKERLTQRYESDCHRFHRGKGGKDTRKEIVGLIESAIKAYRAKKLVAMQRQPQSNPGAILSSIPANQQKDDRVKVSEDSIEATKDHGTTTEKKQQSRKDEEEEEEEKSLMIKSTLKVQDSVREDKNTITISSSSSSIGTTTTTDSTSTDNNATKVLMDVQDDRRMIRETKSTNSSSKDDKEKEEERKEDTKSVPLVSLSMEQSVQLLRKIFPTIDLKPIVEEQGINGILLNEITTMSDVQELKLDSKLKNIHMRALLGALERFRKEGVTA